MLIMPLMAGSEVAGAGRLSDWVFFQLFVSAAISPALDASSLSGLTDGAVKLEILPSQVLAERTMGWVMLIAHACSCTYTHTNALGSVLCPSSRLKINWISVG